MPELPEVETIKNDLSQYIIGRLFTGVSVYDEKLIQQYQIGLFYSDLTGRRIVDITRRGKYLVILLSGEKTLILHLMMTGSLLLNPEIKYERSSRAVFRFDNGDKLLYMDRRRLGRVWLTDDVELIVGKLGIDPFNAGFTVEELIRIMWGHDMPIKAFLLDQTYIAGIGNMYADEALYDAGIHPMKKASSLSSMETDKLHTAIINVLETAIDSKGASVDTYQRPGGEMGYAQFNFRVAHQKGALCMRCGNPVQRIIVRNRGTYYCSYCQKQ
jgi:formamidopyrimidine-DNA glycosylase